MPFYPPPHQSPRHKSLKVDSAADSPAPFGRTLAAVQRADQRFWNRTKSMPSHARTNQPPKQIMER
jgi:hypothetical protein